MRAQKVAGYRSKLSSAFLSVPADTYTGKSINSCFLSSASLCMHVVCGTQVQSAML